MKIIKVKNYEELSRTAATIIAGTILSKPDCILGLATGSSPVGTYDQLAAMYEDGILDFSHVKSVNLDEYVGLDGSNDQSYRYFMNKNLFSRVNIDIKNTYVPDGTNPDADACCSAYNTLLENIGTVDLQLLGIGPNGHIGFNEPADHFEAGTHCEILQMQPFRQIRDSLQVKRMFRVKPILWELAILCVLRAFFWLPTAKTRQRLLQQPSRVRLLHSVRLLFFSSIQMPLLWQMRTQ